MTSPKTQDPLALIKGVVSARHRKEIELQGYADALKVLEQHFAVYEQRLRMLTAPASFPDGEVLLDAAGQGLEQLRVAVDALKGLDPSVSPQAAVSLVKEAETGYELLLQLQGVTEEKRLEFEEAYQEYQENGLEIE
jgi:hypothetical protein